MFSWPGRARTVVPVHGQGLAEGEPRPLAYTRAPGSAVIINCHHSRLPFSTVITFHPLIGIIWPYNAERRDA
jgi:hypothetical protein